jgi:hypothetical protein
VNPKDEDKNIRFGRTFGKDDHTHPYVPDSAPLNPPAAMPKQGRRDGADEEPMDVDAGTGGIEQSRRYPNHGVSATNRRTDGEPAPQGGGRPPEEQIFEQLTGLVISGNKEEAAKLLRGALEGAFEAGRQRERVTHQITTTEAQLTECITKAFAKRDEEQKSKRPYAEPSPNGPTVQTWASIAAGATKQRPQPNPPAKVIPARQAREIVIRIGQQPADLAERSPKAVVEAITTAAGRQGAVAARRLRSGDTVVTFNEGTKEAFITDTE